ncbi:hypothetical protein BDQ12DRAFT_636148 [Crucibulum laeve]|uniref:Uncharacterized protein n=1 Tax=Crucibulum laeve TaxID=68775 RepID=A0A5C3LPY6_9AGAR|nr:hypothetical protein BDQ12DRAFT_636148 [Crucibulum laeve]
MINAEFGSTPPQIVNDMSNPRCYGMAELPSAASERARVLELIHTGASGEETQTPLFLHLSHGLAYTTGSALGTIPPSVDTCLAAYLVPNSAGLTSGARAWSKHSHRSEPPLPDEDEANQKKRKKASAGWWGTPSGPVAIINEKALSLFWKVTNATTWKNLHWLPHQVLVYEVRVEDGYGMRWSQDQGDRDGNIGCKEDCLWVFRGFVEPMMENGHEVGWKRPIYYIPAV